MSLYSTEQEHFWKLPQALHWLFCLTLRTHPFSVLLRAPQVTKFTLENPLRGFSS